MRGTASRVWGLIRSADAAMHEAVEVPSGIRKRRRLKSESSTSSRNGLARGASAEGRLYEIPWIGFDLDDPIGFDYIGQAVEMRPTGCPDRRIGSLTALSAADGDRGKQSDCDHDAIVDGLRGLQNLYVERRSRIDLPTRQWPWSGFPAALLRRGTLLAPHCGRRFWLAASSGPAVRLAQQLVPNC